MKRLTAIFLGVWIVGFVTIAEGATVVRPDTPLEQQIRALEAQLRPDPLLAEQPPVSADLKVQLNALYAQRPENQVRSRRSLDQGGDNCLDVVHVPFVPYADAGTTTGYANDYSTVQSCAAGGLSDAPDVIYELTTQYTGTYTISLCGSLFDTALELRYGGACPGAFQVACNDDYCSLQSQLTVALVAGVTYWIIVDGYNVASGQYALSITDDCGLGCPHSYPFVECDETSDSSHARLDCDGGPCNVDYGGTEAYLPLYPDELRCGEVFTYQRNGENLRDVDWYRFTLSEPAYVDLILRGATYRLDLSAGRPSGCGYLDYYSFSNPCVADTLNLGPLSPGMYDVRVAPLAPPGGPPANYTLLLQAQLYSCSVIEGVIDYPVTTTFSGNTSTAPLFCSLRPSTDQRIRINIPTDGYWSFSLCTNIGPVWDSYIYLMTRCCDATSVVAYDDDGCGATFGLSDISCTHLTAGTYYLIVEGYSATDAGPYTLTVNFCGARPVCPANAQISQQPFLPQESWQVGASDAGTPYQMFEDFTGVTAPISSVRFWGITRDQSSNTVCTEDPMPFQISFYPDSGGQPGSVLCTYTDTLTGTQPGLSYGTLQSYPLWEYNATLHPPCNLSGGWISIVGGGDPACNFFWLSSLSGNAHSLWYISGHQTLLPYDWAMCLGVDSCTAPDSLVLYAQGDSTFTASFYAPLAGTYTLYQALTSTAQFPADFEVLSTAAYSAGHQEIPLTLTLTRPYLQIVATHNCP